MALVVVPKGMVPRAVKLAHAGPTTCDIGPSAANPAGGWVNVVIRAADPVNSPVTPDAAGQYLHCLWKFAKPRGGWGRRRETVGNYQPAGVGAGEGLWVETDPGWFWLGSPAHLAFMGGTPGDSYFVTVDASTPYDDLTGQLDVWEPRFRFSLTSRFVVPVNPEEQTIPGFTPFPLPYPHHHSWFEVEAGQVLSVDAAGGQVPMNPRSRIPLNTAETINVSTGFYKTHGAL
jgi:hypothetical protein